MTKTALAALLGRVGKLDQALADQLITEIKTMTGGRELGLVFDRHIPETVELPGRNVRVFDKVRLRYSHADATWLVTKVRRDGTTRVADLTNLDDDADTRTEPVDDLVVVADFRDPIFPGLRADGERIYRGGTDKPFHAVINAENYHALEALTFAYVGKADCIYIDPPYNKLNKDWKYNNHFVDPDDPYAPSMWLAFMERRLKIAERLLNPENSALIVTIDEKECQRLGLLLEQVFPAASVQMVSSVINPKGTGRTEGLRRVDEYVYVVRIGEQEIVPSAAVVLSSKPVDYAGPRESEDGEEDEAAAHARIGLDWQTCRRRDLASVRPTRPGQFYPIYVNIKTGLIKHVGEPVPHEQSRHTVPERKGCVAVFPVRDDGTEMNWGVGRPTFIDRWQKGYARAGRATPGRPQPYIIQYLKSGPIADIEEGRATVEGRNPDGSVIAFYDEGAAKAVPTQWNLRSHNAEHYGTKVLRALIGTRNFDYPKSLYAVEDVLRLFVKNKTDALILDFFGGSGTTAHAVARLNKQDGGRRRCVLVTNNEVSAKEAEKLREQGHRPGDPEWEALGICEYITKPRVRAAITGTSPEGQPVMGNYKFTDEFPMKDGFDENVEFFTLTYEDVEHVRVDMAFEAVAPLLWLRAGSRGSRIHKQADTFAVADHYGILFDPDHWKPFVVALAEVSDLRSVYVVTDDDSVFQAVSRHLPDVDKVRLYESYLHNFEFVVGKG